MIISCPSCSTDFSVADSMIPQGGRRSRCNRCGHIWDVQPHAASVPQLQDNPHLQRMSQTFPFADRGALMRGAINQWEEELNDILYGKKKKSWLSLFGLGRKKQSLPSDTPPQPQALTPTPSPLPSPAPPPPASPPPSRRKSQARTQASSRQAPQFRARHPGYGLLTILLFCVSSVFFVASLYYALLYPCYDPRSVLVFDFACRYASPEFNIDRLPVEEWRHFLP